MKAVGYRKSLPIDAEDALIDFETAKPEPRGHDIRVAVKAISVNPVDYKVRKRAAPPQGETKILGYDAAGIVDAVGPDSFMFQDSQREGIASFPALASFVATNYCLARRVRGTAVYTLRTSQRAGACS